jgi:hypothetical protein
LTAEDESGFRRDAQYDAGVVMRSNRRIGNENKHMNYLYGYN